MNNKGSLNAAIGLTVEFARSQAALQNRKWRGGALTDIEGDDLWYMDSDTEHRLLWKCQTRLTPSVWRAKNKKKVCTESERLTKTVFDGYDLAHVSFGSDWTKADGQEMQKWAADKIKLVNRWNTSRMANELESYIMLAALHSNVAVGAGTLRPARPHWHLLLAIRRKGGGRDKYYRAAQAMAKLTEITGSIIAWDGSFYGTVAASAGAVHGLVEYLLKYPIGLIDRSVTTKTGNYLAIPLREGLILSPHLPANSKLRKLNSQQVNQRIKVKQIGADTELTDPIALVPSFEMIAGFRTVRSYRPPLICMGFPNNGTEQLKVPKQNQDLSHKNVDAKQGSTTISQKKNPKVKAMNSPSAKLVGNSKKLGKNILRTSFQKEDPNTNKIRTIGIGQRFTNRPEFNEVNPKIASTWKSERAQSGSKHT